VRRREFITLVGGATVWPLAARAQHSAVSVIGFLHVGSTDQLSHVVTAFLGAGVLVVAEYAGMPRLLSVGVFILVVVGFYLVGDISLTRRKQPPLIRRPLIE
jgi:hypothetical protein